MMHSILITSYECGGKGVNILKLHLDAVFSQTYRPLQCVVSDHSRDNVIENMVRTLDTRGVHFIYVRYSENYGNPCHNWNNALKYATGDTLQYSAMDERPAHPKSVEDAVNYMNKTGAKWIACGHVDEPGGQRFIPRWNPHLLSGINTISGPAAIMFRKELRHIQLDPTFSWLLDLDWYYRMFLAAGPPVIFENVTYINFVGDHQLTNTVNNQARRNHEALLIRRKYGDKLPTA
jgi:GT2 family glycosyltransferase